MSKKIFLKYDIQPWDDGRKLVTWQCGRRGNTYFTRDTSLPTMLLTIFTDWKKNYVSAGGYGIVDRTMCKTLRVPEIEAVRWTENVLDDGSLLIYGFSSCSRDFYLRTTREKVKEDILEKIKGRYGVRGEHEQIHARHTCHMLVVDGKEITPEELTQEVLCLNS